MNVKYFFFVFLIIQSAFVLHQKFFFDLSHYYSHYEEKRNWLEYFFSVVASSSAINILLYISTPLMIGNKNIRFGKMRQTQQTMSVHRTVRDKIQFPFCL